MSNGAGTKKVVFAFGLFFFVVGVLGLLMQLLQEMDVISWGFGSILGFMGVTLIGGVLVMLSRR